MLKLSPKPSDASRGGKVISGEQSVDDLIAELVDPALELGTSLIALVVHFTTGRFLGAVRFKLGLSNGGAVKTVHFLLGFHHCSLGCLTGFFQLLSQISFQTFNLSELLLGISSAGGDIALSILHDLADRTEEENIEQVGEENHLNRHQRKGGIEVKETSLRNTCFSEQKPGHGRVRWKGIETRGSEGEPKLPRADQPAKGLANRSTRATTRP